jgi:6,7-dimethyl-8-ribityllumazine synthase
MAGNERAEGSTAPSIDGTGKRVAIVCSRFNDRITLRLLDGARRGLRAAGVSDDDVVAEWVPGSFELPLAAKAFAESGSVDAVIAIGCVIRGETTHYDLVSSEAARGLQDAQLATGVPIAFGVLATEDVDQALARSEDAGGHNVGEECAAAALEMCTLVKRARNGASPRP